MNKKSKSLNIPEIRIPKIIRLSILAILVLIILISLVNVSALYQKDTTSENTIITNVYHQNGQFDYKVHLVDNTVYNKTELMPGEGAYFVQILDHINGSFTYNFQSTSDAEILGSYSITAKIQTDIWQKSYTLVTTTPFNASGKLTYFSVEFPIDYEFYNEVFKTISKEIGITSNDPVLLITAKVSINGKFTQDTFTDSLTQSITLSLNQKIIEVSEELMKRETQTLTATQIVTNPKVFEERNTGTIITIIFTILTIVFITFTNNKSEILSKFEKQLKQINKKYGEWIVETSKNNPSVRKDIIPLSSIDDLQKVSEELGKPMVHYNSKTSKQHEYYILDDDIAYQYILKPDEIIKKIAICPKCKNETTIEGHPGSMIDIECDKCGKKGSIFLDDPNKNNSPLLPLSKFLKKTNKIKK